MAQGDMGPDTGSEGEVMIILITTLIAGALGVTLGYWKGSRDAFRLYDELAADSHRRVMVNPADKIRIPATRSTDLVPEKQS